MSPPFFDSWVWVEDFLYSDLSLYSGLSMYSDLSLCSGLSLYSVFSLCSVLTLYSDFSLCSVLSLYSDLSLCSGLSLYSLSLCFFSLSSLPDFEGLSSFFTAYLDEESCFDSCLLDLVPSPLPSTLLLEWLLLLSWRGFDKLAARPANPVKGFEELWLLEVLEVTIAESFFFSSFKGRC